MKKIKDERIEKKDSQVIMRTFIFQNVLLLSFTLLYDRISILTGLKPNVSIFIIFIITVLYACLDFYFSGTLLSDVESKKDIKPKIKKIIDGLLGVDILGFVLFILNNKVTLVSITQFTLLVIIINALIIIITTALLYLWIKKINN